MADNAPGQNRPILGAVWMLGAIASFTAMQISGRELSSEYDAVTIMLYRGIVGVILMLPIALAFGGISNVTTRRPMGHLVRNAVHFLGQFSWFYGIAHLTLADVTALNSLMPIFSVVLAIMFFGERLTAARIAVISCGFVGVLIVIRPGFIPFEFATGITVMGALFYAVSVVMVKALTGTEPPLRIVFYMIVMQLVFSLALTGGQVAVPPLAELPWIVIVGISGLTAHYCMARSVAIADASVVMPISFLSLPAMALIGYAFYGEGIDPYTLGGGGLILVATYLNIIWSRHRATSLPRQS